MFQSKVKTLFGKREEIVSEKIGVYGFFKKVIIELNDIPPFVIELRITTNIAISASK